MRKNLTDGRNKPLPASQWRSEALDLLMDQRGRFADDETTERNARARDWVKDIEQNLISLVARTVASYGAPVTEKLLDRLRGEAAFVLTELPDEQAKFTRWADEIDQAVSGVLAPTSNALQPENPLLAQGIERGVDCYDHLAEAELRGFAASLLKDLLHNLIDPLQVAVRSAKEVLTLGEEGSNADPSEVSRWP